MIEPREFVIDLFCGAGGTSTGVHLANGKSKVVFCVNHDRMAIETHRGEHPHAKHMVEDIRNPEVLFFLKLRVNALRKLHPNCIITVWASLECTNFSKAKGGVARDADSRTLANYMFDYLEAVNPDYLMIENVVEFMAWGPLDENGRPVSMKRGVDFLKWCDNVNNYGYKCSYKEINSADMGAYTSRNRLFIQFAKYGLPIAWPEATHSKAPQITDNLFGTPLEKWKAVKDILNFENEGLTIFNRKKPLVENTEKRIYAGLIKFIAKGDESFIKKYFSGRPKGKVISVNGPAGTVTSVAGQAIVNCNFILKYNSTNKKGVHKPPSIEDPCPTVAAQNRLGLATANFLQSYYGNGGVHDINKPSPTIGTKDTLSKLEAVFFTNSYSGGGQLSSIENPSPTLTGVPKSNVTTVIFDRKNSSYLYNPQYKSKGSSVHKPCPVIIARQDKNPLSIVICEKDDSFAVPIYETDTETMVKIKFFMAAYGITDIKMRMLAVQELKEIQGFPKNYLIKGTQTQQKKYIGNSVEVNTAKKLFEAHYESLVEYFNIKAA